MLASYADDPGSIPGNGTHVMCHRAEQLTKLRVTGTLQSKVLQVESRVGLAIC